MKSFDAGRKAEQAAAAFLARKGCTIIGQNWRTRWYEIDIVALRATVIYFCEVKYRRQARQGYGLEYITPQKLRRMRFAAECWVTTEHWAGQYQLCAIEVSGQRFRVTAAVKLT